jgi:hypothetical protein
MIQIVTVIHPHCDRVELVAKCGGKANSNLYYFLSKRFQRPIRLIGQASRLHLQVLQQQISGPWTYHSSFFFELACRAVVSYLSYIPTDIIPFHSIWCRYKSPNDHTPLQNLSITVRILKSCCLPQDHGNSRSPPGRLKGNSGLYFRRAMEIFFTCTHTRGASGTPTTSRWQH